MMQKNNSDEVLVFFLKKVSL